jgi:glutathione peroxidase-family protein
MNTQTELHTATLPDGTQIQVKMSPMTDYYKAKRELEALKEKYPNHAERLFGDKDEDYEDYEDDKDYDIQDLLDGAYHKLWNIAQLTMLRGLRVSDYMILKRHAKASNLKWNGQDFVSIDA